MKETTQKKIVSIMFIIIGAVIVGGLLYVGHIAGSQLNNPILIFYFGFLILGLVIMIKGLAGLGS